MPIISFVKQNSNLKLFNWSGVLTEKQYYFQFMMKVMHYENEFRLLLCSITFPGYFISLTGARAMIVKASSSGAFKMASTFMPTVANVQVSHKTTSSKFSHILHSFEKFIKISINFEIVVLALHSGHPTQLVEISTNLKIDFHLFIYSWDCDKEFAFYFSLMWIFMPRR